MKRGELRYAPAGKIGMEIQPVKMDEIKGETIQRQIDRAEMLLLSAMPQALCNLTARRRCYNQLPRKPRSASSNYHGFMPRLDKPTFE